MSAGDFVRRHEAEWERFEALLTAGDKGRTPPRADFPVLYRRVCQHLAIARDRHYPPYVTERLNRLALAGHQELYAARTGLARAILEFVRRDFPALVRRHARLFWIATAFTYLPALAMAALVWWHPEMIYSIVDPAQVREFEEMYRPGRKAIGFRRESDVNFMMFGHYIQNNISIGFRCFAGGLLFGMGAIVLLAFNGLLLGGVAAHLTRLGYAETFFQFVIAHGAFELTAIVLAGAAGMMLGMALISPGRLTRLDALARAAKEAVRIVYGAAGMLLIAAFIEAFWSSSTYFAPPGKFAVGALLWLLVAAYFVFMGRGRAV